MVILFAIYIASNDGVVIINYNDINTANSNMGKFVLGEIKNN